MFQSEKFKVLAMTSIQWTSAGIKTLENITRDTPMEFVTVKMDPTRLCNELSLDNFNILDEHACRVIEHICTDPLYVILVIAQRQISNHNRKSNVRNSSFS